MIDEKQELARQHFREMESWTDEDRTAHAIKIINNILSMVSSAERAEVMLALTRRRASNVFWPVFFHNWPMCDDTWYLRDDLLRQLQRFEDEECGLQFLSPEARAAYDALPDSVRVFRGCSHERVLNVSWTTDRQVAAGFAHGHRGIPVPDPVIATGIVPKSAIYGVCINRGEFDVVLDPHCVVELELEPFFPPERAPDQSWS